MDTKHKNSMNASNDPEAYKRTPSANFTMNNDLEDIYKGLEAQQVKDDTFGRTKLWIFELLKRDIQTPKEMQKQLLKLRKQFREIHKKSALLGAYNRLVREGEIDANDTFKHCLVKKAQKSQSGVLVVTVLTSPYPVSQGKKQKFSCQWNCYYCPNEPNQPRSYLHDEPSVLRANRNHFDAVLQFHDRVLTLENNGHPIDKIELLVLGGTWASYPKDYQEDFIRDLFYAANTYFDRAGKVRERKSLSEEKTENETAVCKIIGITLETRPDCINVEEVKRLRYLGCTRVQLGIQHTYRSVLTKINRECFTEDTIRALQLLKDNCYKIDIHLMPNLPGGSIDIDRDMFYRVLDDPDLQADQWKIYPCETTPWTVIKRWFDNGEYVPYEEDDLMDLLMDVKAKVHPWIRLNRVVRDIPSQYILGGVDNPSMRQKLAIDMAKKGLKCKCIRCREVKGQKLKQEDVELVVRSYPASGGLEYFISIETHDRGTICGFARLRIPGYMCEDYPKYVSEESPFVGEHKHAYDDGEEDDQMDDSRGRSKNRDSGSSRARSKSPHPLKRKKKRIQPLNQTQDPADDPMKCVIGNTIYPELVNASLVRELHVYGQLVTTQDKSTKEAQHVGYGSQLMKKAEELSVKHGATRVAVISGVGVRNFYRKIGYELVGESEMMMKWLPKPRPSTTFMTVVMTMLIVVLAIAIEITRGLQQE